MEFCPSANVQCVGQHTDEESMASTELSHSLFITHKLYGTCVDVPIKFELEKSIHQIYLDQPVYPLT
jgi:hypothetical protein